MIVAMTCVEWREAFFRPRAKFGVRNLKDLGLRPGGMSPDIDELEDDDSDRCELPTS